MFPKRLLVTFCLDISCYKRQRSMQAPTNSSSTRPPRPPGRHPRLVTRCLYKRLSSAKADDEGRLTFSAADKKDITAVYGKNLLKFYVLVVFIEVEKEDFYIGGEPNNKFIRIVSQHLARTDIGEERMNTVVNAIHPFVRDRGYDWEIQIEETGRAGWRENGLAPPLPNTAAERRWKLEDKASAYTREENIEPEK